MRRVRRSIDRDGGNLVSAMARLFSNDLRENSPLFATFGRFLPPFRGLPGDFLGEVARRGVQSFEFGVWNWGGRERRARRVRGIHVYVSDNPRLGRVNAENYLLWVRLRGVL